MRYGKDICDVLCLVIWVVFNQRFHFAINDCRLARPFSVFRIKISTSEPRELTSNNALSYGTISINVTYLSLLFVQCFLPLYGNKRTSNNENASYFGSIFTFIVKAFKIHNPHTNRIERRVEISSFRMCLYMP